MPALLATCLLALLSGLAQAAQPRTLSFVHTHSGEELQCAFSGGDDSAQCRAGLKHLLRDWRTGESHDIDPALFDILYELRLLAGVDAPFEIISAYRSPATNEMLRGKSGAVAENSQHTLGKAIDVRLRGFPTARLGELARGLKRGGSSYYAASDFVHVDCGRVRSW